MIIRRVVLEDTAVLSKLGADTFYDTLKGTCINENMDGFLIDYFNIEQV